MVVALGSPQPVFTIPPLDTIPDGSDDKPQPGRNLVSPDPTSYLRPPPLRSPTPIIVHVLIVSVLFFSSLGGSWPFESLVFGLWCGCMVPLL